MAGETDRKCPCGGPQPTPKFVKGKDKAREGKWLIACSEKSCKASAEAIDKATAKFIWFNRTSHSLRALTQKGSISNMVKPQTAE